MVKETVKEVSCAQAQRAAPGKDLQNTCQLPWMLYQDLEQIEALQRNLNEWIGYAARTFFHCLEDVSHIQVAIQFLRKAVHGKGRGSGLLRLLQEMRKQAANPALSALKHSCTNLLIEFALSEEDQEFPYLCEELENQGQICYFYQDLDLVQPVRSGMGQAVVYFTAHSQARKAMMALKDIQYFPGMISSDKPLSSRLQGHWRLHSLSEAERRIRIYLKQK